MLGFQPPAIGEEEIAAVAETLRSGWLTTGPKAAELERRFAEFVEAEHVLAVASGTAALHLRAARRRRRPGRRGDHDSDHLAGDRERDRPRGRDAGVRGRARLRPQHRPRRMSPSSSATGRRRSCPSTSPASPPTWIRCSRHGIPVVEDAAHAAESAYRGRKVGVDRRRDLLLALRDEEHRGRGGRPDLDERRDDRGGDREPAPDAPRRRLALRHRRPRLQGEPLGRAGGDRALPARQGGASRRDPPAPVRRLRRGGRGARRDRAARPRRPRHARATTSTSSESTPSGPERRATSTSGCSPRRTSRRASTSSPCTS